MSEHISCPLCAQLREGAMPTEIMRCRHVSGETRATVSADDCYTLDTDLEGHC
jgi:hypothetical protein